MKFFCTGCNREFETNNPSKKEYKDYLLGSCWKYISYCPSCGEEADEKRIPKIQKSREPVTPQPYCGNDCCGCCSE